MTKFCKTCQHPRHDYGPCDVVKTSARIGWSSRCECSDYPMTTEAWRERAPSQRDRLLQHLREAGGGWFCAIAWNKEGILRYGARIWELRHEEGHEIEEHICAQHKVAEYRLVYDAKWDREP